MMGVQDVIDVGPSLGLPTTNGAYSMLESFPKKNSLVVEKVLLKDNIKTKGKGLLIIKGSYSTLV